MANYFNTSLRNLNFRLRKFRLVLDKFLREEIEKREDLITEMVRAQLWDGKTGLDNDIYPPYRMRTIKRKIKKGQPYDRVTLRDRGHFYKSFKLKYDEGGFRIIADDKKAKYLLAKYGDEILRLANANLKIVLNQYIRPSLSEKLKEYLENNEGT